MKSHEHNEAEFLTTIENWDLMELLARISNAPNVLVAIEVQPRHTPTAYSKKEVAGFTKFGMRH